MGRRIGSGGAGRRALALALVAAAAMSTPGCMIAVGSTTHDDEDRVDRLERRIADAERRLGIEPHAASTEVQR